MGTLTLSQFRAELSFDLLQRNDAGFSDTRLNLWINWAYMHLAHPTVHYHRELETSYTYTLATGTNTLSMASGTVGFTPTHIRSVFWSEDDPSTTPTTTKAKVRPVSIQTHDQRIVPSGRPAQYAIDGTSLILLQSPSSTENGQYVTARFYREPADLSADSDTTVLGKYWDEVLSLGAKWRAEQRLGFRELAELTKQDYAALINEIADQPELEAADTGWEVELVGAPI